MPKRPASDDFEELSRSSPKRIKTEGDLPTIRSSHMSPRTSPIDASHDRPAPGPLRRDYSRHALHSPSKRTASDAGFESGSRTGRPRQRHSSQADPDGPALSRHNPHLHLGHEMSTTTEIGIQHLQSARSLYLQDQPRQPLTTGALASMDGLWGGDTLGSCDVRRVYVPRPRYRPFASQSPYERSAQALNHSGRAVWTVKHSPENAILIARRRGGQYRLFGDQSLQRPMYPPYQDQQPQRPDSVLRLSNDFGRRLTRQSRQQEVFFALDHQGKPHVIS